MNLGNKNVASLLLQRAVRAFFALWVKSSLKIATCNSKKIFWERAKNSSEAYPERARIYLNCYAIPEMR